MLDVATKVRGGFCTAAEFRHMMRSRLAIGRRGFNLATLEANGTFKQVAGRGYRYHRKTNCLSAFMLGQSFSKNKLLSNYPRSPIYRWFSFEISGRTICLVEKWVIWLTYMSHLVGNRFTNPLVIVWEMLKFQDWFENCWVLECLAWKTEACTCNLMAHGIRRSLNAATWYSNDIIMPRYSKVFEGHRKVFDIQKPIPDYRIFIGTDPYY